MFRCQRTQPHAGADSLLKKGTGTSPGALFGGLIGHELGASPLFQHPAKTAVIASAIMVTFLLAEVVAANHHDCDVGGDQQCAVCMLAKAPSCLPQAVPPILPAPTIQRRLVLLPVSQPSSRPVFAMPARGPPLKML